MTSTSTTTSYQFGRLDWNVTKEAYTTLATIADWSNLLLIYELTVIVFFVVNFCKKNSQFRTPYYTMYTIGCVVNFITKFLIYANKPIKASFLSDPITLLVWYNNNFITFWNVWLAFNRFYAIMFPLKFDHAWTMRRCAVLCLIQIFYPFIIHSFNLSFLWCDCPISSIRANETEFERTYALASDITFSVVATILCLIAAGKMLRKRKEMNQLPEKVLLVQTLASSIFLIMYSVTMWLAAVNKISSATIVRGPEATRIIILQSFLSNLATIFYSLHHNTGLILLIIMSHSFRTKYKEFYKLNHVLKHLPKLVEFQKKHKKNLLSLLSKLNICKKKNKIRTITIPPAAAATPTVTYNNRQSRITIVHHR